MNTNNSAQFAKLAGVVVKTLQRWDREGKLKPAARTPGN
jgi:DNA-binding transcriptional MerR regulator